MLGVSFVQYPIMQYNIQSTVHDCIDLEFVFYIFVVHLLMKFQYITHFLFTCFFFPFIADSLKVYPNKPTISQSTSAVVNNDLQDKSTKTDENLNLSSKQKNYSNETANKDEEENQNAGDANILHQNEASTDTDSDMTNIYTPTSNGNDTSTSVGKEQINDKRSDDKDVDTDTSENMGKSSNIEGSKTHDENKENVVPTRTPTSFISTAGNNEMTSSDSQVEEKSDLSTVNDQISDHEDTPKDSGRDDKNNHDIGMTANSKISRVPTRAMVSKSHISKDNEERVDEEVKKDKDAGKTENIKKDHPAQLPTSGSTKRHGLGLQESLGLLEPTESSLKVIHPIIY